MGLMLRVSDLGAFASDVLGRYRASDLNRNQVIKYLSFGIGLSSNKETNDFLRCLWSRVSAMFGKLVWHYSPYRMGNMIHVGQACVGDNLLIEVRLHYKIRGCLSNIEFIPNDNFDIVILEKQLKQCISEAYHYHDYIHCYRFKSNLDKNISFKKIVGRNYGIYGNKILIKVLGYDKTDAESMAKSQLIQICNFLSFDTLKYITISNSLIEEIRTNHKNRTTVIDIKTGIESDVIEQKEVYKGLELSINMGDYIDDYLDRSFMYEEHLMDFDKSVQLFSQGLRNEELSLLSAGLPDPYTELAILNYMSALEVITINDHEPVLCDTCGQMKYSIARRVIDLSKQAIPGGDVFVKRYYCERSKYVHTGALLSNNSYMGISIPLMSVTSNSGMISQLGMIDFGLKEMVKSCIEWHEKNRNKHSQKDR